MNLKEWSVLYQSDILKDWDSIKNKGVSPEMFVPGSGKRVWWKCSKCGYEWEVAIRKRTEGHGCPCCKNRVLVKGVNDLLTKDPILCKEWDYEKNGDLTPDMFSSSSKEKVWWRCKIDPSHSWKASINNRFRGAGCLICAGNTLIKGINDLATSNPNILIEWDYEKNSSLTPDMFSQSSNERVWWKCSKCGKEWETAISSHRIPGCPDCNRTLATSKRKLSLLKNGENSLAVCRPDIAVEWNYEKNGVLTPEMVSTRSGNKVWWKCSKCGYEWKCSIDSRKRPHCKKCNFQDSGEKIRKTKIDRNGNLLERYPEIVKDWNYEKNKDILPSDFASTSKEFVWWKCSVCGHEIRETIGARVRNSGCRVCKAAMREKEIIKNRLKNPNNLETACPELVLEWDYKKNGNLKPSMFLKSGKNSVWWKCSKCGHSWYASIGSRAVGCGCPKCPSRLGTSFPEQAIYFYVKKHFSDAINSYSDIFTNNSEIDIFIPSLRIGIEYDGEKWHSSKSALEKEHQKYITCQNNNIKLIRIKEKIVDEHDLWCDKVFISFYKRNNYQVLGKTIIELLNYLGIEENINLEQDYGLIQKQYLELLEDNSIESLKPELVREWDYEKNGGLSPKSVMAKSSNLYWWKCEKGHSFKQSAYSRFIGSTCPICNNHQVLEGYNDLETLFPNISKEWDISKNKGTPKEYVFGSPYIAYWKCSKCGYEWKTSIRKRTKDGTGCPKCSYESAGLKNASNYIANSNSLYDLFPDVCKNWDYEKNGNLSPKMFVPGSGKKVYWKCHHCGHELGRAIRDQVRSTICQNCKKKWTE